MELILIEFNTYWRELKMEEKINPETDLMDSSGCASSEPFALRVMGDSMEPEFKDGCIIIIDPSGNAAHGSYVIAEIDGEYIFRQFVQEGDQYMLKAVNEGYPVTQLDDVSVVRGVVTQRAGTRRTYHKHYD